MCAGMWVISIVKEKRGGLGVSGVEVLTLLLNTKDSPRETAEGPHSSENAVVNRHS